MYQKLNVNACLQKKIECPIITRENRMLTTNQMGYIYEVLGPVTQVFLVGLPIYENKFDAILIDKVLHFMTPNEIEMQLEYVKKALTVGGRLYIVTVTPHHPHFRKKFLPIYLQRRDEGVSYPGYIPDDDFYFRGSNGYT